MQPSSHRIAALLAAFARFDADDAQVDEVKAAYPGLTVIVGDYRLVLAVLVGGSSLRCYIDRRRKAIGMDLIPRRSGAKIYIRGVVATGEADARTDRLARLAGRVLQLAVENRADDSPLHGAHADFIAALSH